MPEPPINPNARVRLEFMGEAFQWFGKAWKDWSIATIPIIVIFAAYLWLTYSRSDLSFERAANPDTAPELLGSILKISVPFLVTYYVLFCGLIQMGVKQVRGEPITWRDGFTLGDNAGGVLGATVIVGLLTSVSAFFCCLPALFVIAGSMLTFPLVTDLKLGPLQALQLSWRTAGRQIWACIGLMILGTGVSVVSFYVLLLGAFLGVPVYALTFALVYREFFGNVQNAPAFSLE